VDPVARPVERLQRDEAQRVDRPIIAPPLDHTANI